MLEKSAQNEAFVLLHEKLKEEGHDPKTMVGRNAIIEQAIKSFPHLCNGKSARHNYRAWVARLADTNKYKGLYSSRMKPFQMTRADKTTPEVEATPIPAEATPITPNTVEEPVLVANETNS